MKLIGHVHDQNTYQDTVSLLHTHGIPTFTKYSGAPGIWPRSFRAAIFVSLDMHYDDALALLKNPSHSVAQPVDVEQFLDEQQNNPISSKFVLATLILLAAVVAFFILATRLADIQWQLGT